MKRNRREFLGLAALAPGSLAIGGLPLVARADDAGPGKVRIGIIGSGNVGSALGGVWVKAAHEVMFSSRTLERDRTLAAKLGPNARAGTPREAAAFGDVVMIAVHDQIAAALDRAPAGSYLIWASSLSNRSLLKTKPDDSLAAAFFACSRLTGWPTWMTPTIPIRLCAVHA